jgi:hypothetical protein
MRGLGRTVTAAVAACVLATTAQAQRASGSAATIDTLAREWSAGLGAPRCEDVDFEEGAGVKCAWGPAHDAARDWLTHSVVRGGAASMAMRNHVALDPAGARRIVDALEARLVARGARRRDCGTLDVPAGRTSGTLWEGDGLSAFASSVARPDGTWTVLAVATDDPAVTPVRMLCPR